MHKQWVLSNGPIIIQIRRKEDGATERKPEGKERSARRHFLVEMREELLQEQVEEHDGEEVAEAEAESSPSSPSSVWKQPQKKQSRFVDIAEELIHGDLQSQIRAAKDIRKLIRSYSSSTSSARARSRFVAAGVLQPLILMLSSSNLDAREASLLALLNLAVRNERNKIKIVASGAVLPLIELLKFQNSKLPELATAAILTLSGAAPNKSVIAANGAVPLLIQILRRGSIQGKVDAVTALHNLAICAEDCNPELDAVAVTPLISLLKDCKKYSKFAEKSTALLQLLANSEEGRTAITNTSGGILTLVETVEDGSRVSTEHAVGALLLLCQSCRSKYRELILKEGAIPGLLRLTAEGTVKAQERARRLLDLLRDTPQNKRLSSTVLEGIVYDFAKKVDGADKAAESAKRLLQGMVHRSMELSMNGIQLRVASSTSSDKSSGKPSL